MTVADIASVHADDADNQVLLQRAIALPALPERWRDHLRKRLRGPDS